MNKRRSLLMVGSAWPLAMFASSFGALAQANYPSQPIRLIVPLPPGSPPDAIARKLAELVGPSFGVPVIVDNRPGAAATIGAAEVARATPDGHTFLVTVAEPLVSAVAVMKVPYDPQRDFKLISKVAVSTSGPVLLASTKVSASNLPDLISEARAASTPLTYASYGPGSFPQQILETLAGQAKIKLTEVPYKGSPPALADLVAGHVALGLFSVEQSAGFVAGGKLKAIALVDKSAVLPQVQTFAEAGFASFVFRNKPWIGLVGPAGVSDAISQRWEAAVKTAIADPGFTKFLRESGFDPLASTSQQFLEEYRAEMNVIPRLIRDLGVKPQ